MDDSLFSLDRIEAQTTHKNFGKAHFFYKRKILQEGKNEIWKIQQRKNTDGMLMHSAIDSINIALHTNLQ